MHDSEFAAHLTVSRKVLPLLISVEKRFSDAGFRFENTQARASKREEIEAR